MIYSTFMRILNIAVIVFCYLNYKQDHNFVIIGSFGGVLLTAEWIHIIESLKNNFTLKSFFEYRYHLTKIVLPYYAFVGFYYFTRNKLSMDIFMYIVLGLFLILFAIGLYRMVTQLYNRFSKKEVTK